MLEEKSVFEAMHLFQPPLIKWMWPWVMSEGKRHALLYLCVPTGLAAGTVAPLSKKILQHLDLGVRIISGGMDVEKWGNLPAEQGLLFFSQRVWEKLGQRREQAPLHYKD